MAFCENCGAQLGGGAAACPSCGAARTPVPGQPAVSQYVPVTAEQARGFLSSLFDLSFTSFIATKLIKVLYVLAIVGAGLAAISIAVAGFSQGTATGVLMLIIVAPLAFLAAVIYARVVLEIIIVVFRMAEHLAEIAEQGRRTP
jgi:Domain of unknown function (DUF4282)